VWRCCPRAARFVRGGLLLRSQESQFIGREQRARCTTYSTSRCARCFDKLVAGPRAFPSCLWKRQGTHSSKSWRRTKEIGAARGGLRPRPRKVWGVFGASRRSPDIHKDISRKRPVTMPQTYAGGTRRGQNSPILIQKNSVASWDFEARPGFPLRVETKLAPAQTLCCRQKHNR